MHHSSVTTTSNSTHPHVPPGELSHPRAAGAPEISARPSRGRPSGYSERVVGMVKDVIRDQGVSDSAAAVRVGMSASTISRWKRDFPEVAPGLQKAREECRDKYFDIVKKHAEEENGRGLRAAMWILERKFPAEFARKISERSEALNHEEVVRIREESAALQEQLREEEAERKAQAAAAREAEEERKKQASASEEVLHNLHNSGAEVSGEADAPIDPRPAHPQTPPPSETEFRSQGHSQTGVWERAGAAVPAWSAQSSVREESRQPNEPVEAEIRDAASVEALHHLHNSKQPRRDDISTEPPARAENLRALSEDGLHNLQNIPMRQMSAQARGAAEWLRANEARLLHEWEPA